MFKVIISLISLSFFSTAQADFEIGGTLYTNTAFHAEKGKSYTTNYRAGKCIPRGSEVAVLNVTRKSAKIMVKYQNVGVVKLINIKKYSKLSMEQYLNRLLSKTKPTNKGLTKSKLNDIQSCRATTGMTKDDVIAAMGYPPAHVTTSTESDQWKYWRKRFDTELYFFKDDKLMGIED